MNIRIRNFISEIQRLADLETQIYALKKLYQQMWEEEFRNNRDNALNDPDNVSSDEWEELAFEYDDVNDFVTNIIDHAITFAEGGDTLVDRERLKFARRVMAGNRNMI